MNLKRILSLLLCLVLVFGCVVPLASCKKDDDPDNTPTPGGSVVGGDGGSSNGTANYTVQVKTVGGMPLKDVKVTVFGGATGEEYAALPQDTDENGTVVFELQKADNYTLSLENVPKGYNVLSGDTKETRYPMGVAGAVITLSSAPIATGGFSNSYKLGDVMYDFTLTDVEGVDYKLSELLKTKKMVMINFWYRDCSNCAYEFPYINAVYEDYANDLEMLAVNDYRTDTVDMVKGYSDFLGEDLKMPLIKVGNSEYDLTLSRFPSEGYPTTVIIDRYGVICMIEVGAVLGENKWKSIFDHFTAENYEQKLVNSADDIIPVIEPTIKWDENSEAQISGAFNSGDINVSYHPELSEKDAKYSWPFIADTFGEGEDAVNCVRPSNDGIDNSFSILYADIKLKPGQAVVFDYFSSTQRGADVLFVLVDGKDIYSISGDSTEEGWSTCCTYVDPRPVLDSNKDVEKTYEIAFAYYKDDFDHFGDDTVYLKDLRVIGVDEIEIESYIFRYAATELNSTESGYNTYANVYLGTDGYYHVGSPDDANGENDPFLLANLLSYSNFDPYKTVSERIYGAGDEESGGKILVNGVNKFDQWLIYGNAASNSQIAYYTAVTEELKEILVAYCDTYRRDVGKSDHPNLWLQLCAYYDAYGKDENGNPAKQLENPIKGLTSFSAYDAVMDDPATPEKETNTVTYNRVIMPKGYIYKFTPTVSGVYRVNSDSDQEVVGWIFTGSSADWALQGGDRTIISHYDVGERYNPDLLIDPDGDGVKERDFVNTSLVAYMEAGKDYYIDIAYYDVYATGTFTFDIKYVGENFGYFIQASSGPITYVEGLDGSMGKLVATGITPVFASAIVCENALCGELVGFTAESDLDNVVCAHCGNKLTADKASLEAKLATDGKNEKYAFHKKGIDENGYTVLGMVIYADFYMPTTLFPSQSVESLIIANAFNFTINELDREALIILDGIKLDGKDSISKDKWTELSMDEVIRYAWKHANVDENYSITFDLSESSYTDEQKEAVSSVIAKGMEALRDEWGSDFEENWSIYNLTDIINNCLKTGTFHNTDNRTDKDIKAQEYLRYIAENPGEENGRNLALMAYWDAEFDSILIEAEGNGDTRNVSERRYDYFWEYYQIDDVKNGVFHGKIANYTNIIEGYVTKMENDVENNPERQGCVAVTEELAEILLALIDKEVFENVENGWLKFCYYYDILGA